VARAWYPEADAVLLVDPSHLKPVEELRAGPEEIAYITAAARVADALEENVLLAPIESSVIPLPHQVVTLLKAVSSDRVRLLLADEVGLGKTIEAGLIIKELKLRGMVRRVLVVAPKGLVSQWVAEMRTHFGEEFRLLLPGDFPAFRRVAGQDNVWKMYNQIVCPMDSVKPIDSRRGWSAEQIQEYNRDRFEDLLAANWDLIVVDEAHRLGGTTDQVARYKLGQGLAEAAPYLLLLSATPHQGKSDAFHRLVSLLDKTAFPDATFINRERLEPYLSRTEKRRAIDAQGNPLFKPRRTQLVPIQWESRHALQRQLYEAISEYVRIGYNQAIREKKAYVGFLLLLMQRPPPARSGLLSNGAWNLSKHRKSSFRYFHPDSTKSGPILMARSRSIFFCACGRRPSGMSAPRCSCCWISRDGRNRPRPMPRLKRFWIGSTVCSKRNPILI
jgi:hypothetical protein